MQKEYSAIPDEEITKRDYLSKCDRKCKNARNSDALHAYEDRQEKEEADPLFDEDSK